MSSDIQKKLPEGFNLQAFLSLDSTNKEAARRIADGASTGLWITAGEQLSGRGRGDREWVSQPGNLYASLIYETQGDIYGAAQLSFVTALAVRDTVFEFLQLQDIKCKWPNDILVDGRKISGILLESSTALGTGKNYMIIGIGINITHHPDVALYEATHINEQTGQEFCQADVFVKLAEKMAYWLALWEERGFDPIRESWLSNARGLGEQITVRLPNEQLIGRFVDLDRGGALKLEVDDEIKLIHSGDVFFTS
tara:strand:+ start:14476 stop:15234 length:759 start_codon:yes stop_codon:yes gene_type:complete